jgi:hypothetical protein
MTGERICGSGISSSTVRRFHSLAARVMPGNTEDITGNAQPLLESAQSKNRDLPALET